MSLFAHLLERLAAKSDGDGSLLDHTMLLYGCGMSDSNVHLPDDLPTLIVAGRRDSVVGYTDAADLLERYPRAALAVIEDAGHALMHERPELLAAFFSDCQASLQGYARHIAPSPHEHQRHAVRCLKMHFMRSATGGIVESENGALGPAITFR